MSTCKVEVSLLANAVNHASMAIGKEDTLRIRFAKNRDTSFLVISAYDGKSLQIEAKVPCSALPEEAPSAYYVKASTFSATVHAYQQIGVSSIDIVFSDTSIELQDGNGKATFSRALGAKALDDDLTNSDGHAVGIASILKATGIGRAGIDLKALTAAYKDAAYAAGTGVLEPVYFDATGEAGDKSSAYHMYAIDSARGSHTSVMVASLQIAADVSVEKQKVMENGAEVDKEVEVSRPRSISAMSFAVLPAFGKALSALTGDTVIVALAEKFITLKDQTGTVAIIALAKKDDYPIATVKNILVSRKAVEAGEAKKFAELGSIKISRSAFISVADICETLSTAPAYEKTVVVKGLLEGSSSKIIVEEASGKARRELPGTVTVTGNEGAEYLAEGIYLSAKFIKDIAFHLSGDDLYFKVSKGAIAFFDGPDIASGFLMMRKAPSATEKEE